MHSENTATGDISMKQKQKMTREEYWNLRNKIIGIFWRVFFTIAIIVGICVYCWMDEKENPFQFTYRVVHDYFYPPEVVEERIWEQLGAAKTYITTKDKWADTLELFNGDAASSLLITNEDNDTLLNASGIIRVRNTEPAIGLKKTYDILLDEPAEIHGMGSSRRWRLESNCFDPTLLRHYSAFQLAQALGLPYTPPQRMTELWIDGKYLGCYVLSGIPEAGEDRIPLDTANGDFLISRELSKLEKGATFFVTDNNLRFQILEPSPIGETQTEAVRETVNNVFRVLASGDYAAVCDVLDTDSFARAYILNELYRTSEYNYTTVTFFCKDGKLYAGPSWNYDLSTGNHKAPHLNLTDGLYIANYQFYPLLMEYPEFRALTGGLYVQFQPQITALYSDDGLLDTLGNTHKDVFHRNFSDAGWVEWGRYLTTEREPEPLYADNVLYLRNWLQQRNEWLLEYWTPFAKE